MLQEILEIQAKGYVGSKLEGRGSRACVENWTAQMGNAEGLCLLSGPQAGSCRLVQDQDGADFCFVGVFMKDCYYILLFLNNYFKFFFPFRGCCGSYRRFHLSPMKRAQKLVQMCGDA